MGPQVITPPDRSPTCSSKWTKNTDSSVQPGQSTSSSENTNTSGMQIIRKSLPSRGVSEKSCQSHIAILEREYAQTILHLPQQWLLFCSSRGLDPYQATPTQALDLMTELCEQAKG